MKKEIVIICVLLLLVLSGCAKTYYETYFMLADHAIFFDVDPEEVQCNTYEVIQVVETQTADYRGMNCDDMDMYVLFDGEYIELYRFLDTHEVTTTDLIESNLFYTYNNTPIDQQLNIDVEQLILLEVRDLRKSDGTTALLSDDPEITVLEIMYTDVQDHIEEVLKHEMGFDMYYSDSGTAQSYGPSSDVIFTFTDGTNDFYLHLRNGTTLYLQSIQTDPSQAFFALTIQDNIQDTIDLLYGIVNTAKENNE